MKYAMQENGNISTDFIFTTGQSFSDFIFHKTSNLTIILLLKISDISNKPVNSTKDKMEELYLPEVKQMTTTLLSMRA